MSQGSSAVIVWLLGMKRAICITQQTIVRVGSACAPESLVSSVLVCAHMR